MELKELAPSLTLCKLIPAGKFEDSVFIWMEVIASKTQEKAWSLMEGTPYARQRPNRKLPAPTLQEIIKALPQTIKMDFAGGVFHIYNDIPNGYGVANENMCNAALKLWLVINGVKF